MNPKPHLSFVWAFVLDFITVLAMAAAWLYWYLHF